MTTTQLQNPPSAVHPIPSRAARVRRRPRRGKRSHVDPNKAVLTFFVAGGAAMAVSWLGLSEAVASPYMSTGAASASVWVGATVCGFVVGAIGAWKTLNS